MSDSRCVCEDDHLSLLSLFIHFLLRGKKKVSLSRFEKMKRYTEGERHQEIRR